MIIKRKYILIILLILLLLPIFLNWILQQPSVFSIIGDAETWLQVWITYAGVLISSSITFIVLYMTIKSNKQNLDKNYRINNQEKKIADISNFLDEFISELAPNNWFETPISKEKQHYQSKSKILTILNGRVDLRFINDKINTSEEKAFIDAYQALSQRYSLYVNRMLRIAITLEQDDIEKAQVYIRQTSEFDLINGIGHKTFSKYFSDFFTDAPNIEAIQVFLDGEINKEFGDAIQYCFQQYTVLLANSKLLKQSYTETLKTLLSNN